MVIGSAFRPSPPVRRVPLLLALAIAACVPAPPTPAPVPRPTPQPRPTPVPSPTLASNWEDWPRTPGDWRYERDARGSRALFGATGQDALAVLRCDAAPARITLSRAGGAATSLTIRTTSMTRAVRATASTGTPTYAMAVFQPRDALLDAIAFTRGRFTIEAAGEAPLVLPPWGEVMRVIEDCRG